MDTFFSARYTETTHDGKTTQSSIKVIGSLSNSTKVGFRETGNDSIERDHSEVEFQRRKLTNLKCGNRESLEDNLTTIN